MARFVRCAPRKLRRQADMARGKPLDEARALLFLSRSPAARQVGRVLDSAAANAENNHDMNPESLHVAQIAVDESRRVLTRVRARARGRRDRRVRRLSHITVVLTDEPEEE
ncbi:MAG: 50S ribosomal protein L22 [Armatimonadota bacterium]